MLEWRIQVKASGFEPPHTTPRETNVFPCTGPPPPPDLLETRSRAAEIHAQREQMRRGENDRYPEPGTTEYETFINEEVQALVQTRELIKELGNTQPILKSLLDTAVVELEKHVANPGRQLLQREDYSYLMTDALSEHALQKSVGLRGIPGLTSFSCEALCSAVAAEADANCKAFGFRRSDPWSRTDLTGSCHLLKNAGACKVEVTRCPNLTAVSCARLDVAY